MSSIWLLGQMWSKQGETPWGFLLTLCAMDLCSFPGSLVPWGGWGRQELTAREEESGVT